MVGRIGNRLVASLQPKDKPYQVHDADIRRFFIRVQPSGVMIYGCTATLPDGRRSTRTIGRHGVFTPSQAREEARRMLADLTRGIDPAAATRLAREHTLKSFLDEEYGPWALANQKRGQATLDMIESSFSDLMEKKLNEINAWLLEKWKTHRIKSDQVKLGTVNRNLDSIRAALSRAVAWGYLPANPAKQVKRSKLDNSVVRFLTDEEDADLEKQLRLREDRIRRERRSANQWRATRGYELLSDLDRAPFADHLLPMVRLSRNLGLRRGELFQLRLEHVDFGNRIVTIVADNAKNGRTRHIPLNAIAFDTIQAWVDQNGIKDSLVFPGADGKPMNNVNKAWKTVLTDAGIKKFRWHDMRHDFCSRLVMSGVDLNTVRELVGHSDIKMTLRYAHLAPQVKADAVARLNRLPQAGIQQERKVDQGLLTAIH